MAGTDDFCIHGQIAGVCSFCLADMGEALRECRYHGQFSIECEQSCPGRVLSDLAACRARCEELEREVANWRHENAQLAVAYSAEVRRLREALAKYGRCLDDCDIHFINPCDCGYDRALNPEPDGG